MYSAFFLFILVLHRLLLGIWWNNNLAKLLWTLYLCSWGQSNILLACELNAFMNFNSARPERINLIFALGHGNGSIIFCHNYKVSA